MDNKNNRTVTMKPGETGSTILVTFKDADNRPIDLTNYEPTIIIATRSRSGARTVVLSEEMVKMAAQTGSGKGKARFTFNEEQAQIAVGSYDIELVLRDGTVEVIKFPKQPGIKYGTLVVQETIVVP